MKTIPLSKKCSSCKKEKPVGEFCKNRARHDGLSNICKVCRKAWTKSKASRRAQTKWRKSDAGKAARDRYIGSDKAKACRKKYANTIHGQLVIRFGGIKGRCERPDHKDYDMYGARGIKCNFTRDNFVDYIIEHWPLESYRGYELHRKDNNGHYERGNVEILSMDDHKEKHVQMRVDEIPF